MDNEWIRGALGNEISNGGISSGFLATLDGAGNSNAAHRSDNEQQDWEVHDGSGQQFPN